MPWGYIYNEGEETKSLSLSSSHPIVTRIPSSALRIPLPFPFKRHHSFFSSVIFPINPKDPPESTKEALKDSIRNEVIPSLSDPNPKYSNRSPGEKTQ
jgi:hypothetical protein